MKSSDKNINPNFRKQPRFELSLEACLEGARSADPAVLAYLISKAESRLIADQHFVREFIARAEVSHDTRRLAISGSPGVGKSSFIDTFGNYLVEQGHKIAVLPVDPSSYLSKGSIMGDKTRMEHLSRSDMAFIKPMPSSLALGGLAPASAVAVMICERSCFDYVILETVGVGQSEIEARDLVDMFILLLQPGGGDDLQGIKRGIMELADLFVVTKADGALLESAKETIRLIRQATGLLLNSSFGWKAKLLTHSSETKQGNPEVYECISSFFAHMQEDGRLDNLRKQQLKHLFKKQSHDILMQFVLKNDKIADTINSIYDRLDKSEIEVIEALKILEDTLDEIP